MKQNERELLDAAYTSVKKKNMFIAEAEDPMRVVNRGVEQYLPRKSTSEIKVPIKPPEPAPVQQVSDEGNNDDLHTTMGKLLEDIEFADKIDPKWAAFIAKELFIPLARGQKPDIEHIRQVLSNKIKV